MSSKGSGFTLIELLVAVSIIAILSTIGISNYQGVQSKVRDDVRKQDLSKLTTALELYLDSNNSYIAGTGSCDQDSPLFYSQITPYFTSDQGVPKDPLTKGDYCYLSVNSGQSYYLCAKLENCSDPDIQLTQEQCASAQYNYALASEDLTRSQSYAPCLPVPSPTPSPTPVPTSTPTAMATAKPTPTPQPTPTPIPTSTPFIPPPQICNGFTIDNPFPPINTGEYIGVKPLILTSWDNISKVELRLYEYPQPLAPPFTEAKWTKVGQVTKVYDYQCLRWEESCGEVCETYCAQYDTTPSGYHLEGSPQWWSDTDKTRTAIQWASPNYPGDYYLGMEVYDNSGKKIAGWNTGNPTKCTQVASVRAYPNTCRADDPVYPYNLKGSAVGDDVLLQWQVVNSSGPYNDNIWAYQSTQAGFTTSSSNRVVSRLKSNATSAHDDSYGMANGTYFYKVSAFGAGLDEGPASLDQASINFKRWQCNSYYGPPSASELRVSGNTFSWKYNSSYSSLMGWYLKRSDGLRFHLPQAEVTTYSGYSWQCGWYDPWNSCARWTMDPALAGTYTIVAYGGCGSWLGGESNSAAISSATGTGTPTGPPSGIGASGGEPGYDSVDISWKDNSPNEAGFHIYRSKEPLDLTKSQPPFTSNSGLQWAYFQDLSPGPHYLAVQIRNSCGEGWSNYVKVDVPGGTVQGIQKVVNFFEVLIQKAKDIIFP